MKVECSRELILEAIIGADRVTSKQSPLTAIHSILITAEKKSLSIKATNLDIGVDYNIPAKVEKIGSCAVSGTILNGLISNIAPGTLINLELVGSQLHISSKRQSTLIKTLPSDDFPIIPQIPTEDIISSISISIQGFINGIKSVYYSAAITDIKPEIASVYLEQDKDELIFVSTDMFRLAKKSIKFESKSKEKSHVLIPIKNTVEIMRLCEKIQGELTIHYSKNELTINAENIYIYSRTISGNFLDYTQAIPVTSKTTVRLSKAEFTSALRASSVFADKFHLIRVKIQPEDNLFEITSQNQDTGESTITIDGVYSGEEIEVNFNAKLILDVLAVITEDEIELSFVGTQKPMTIRGVGDKSFLYVVAPLNR